MAATSLSADALSEMVWSEIWSPWRLRQREFFNFGMEVLLKLNLAQTRQFFQAFFDLPDYYWQVGLGEIKCSRRRCRYQCQCS